MPSCPEPERLALPIPLDGVEVTLWLFRLDLPPAELAQLAELLDAGERARAAQFRFRADRDRFVARRGQVRRLLGRCLDTSPEALRFDISDHGKPLLAEQSSLRFNTSSAGVLGLCVLSGDADVGCDIAVRDDTLCDLAVAERFFAPAEHRALLATPTAYRQEAFLNCWTRKEAYVKGLGEGLTHPLNSFVVSLLDEPCPTLLGARPGWSLRSVPLPADYRAAIAIRPFR